MKFCFLGNVSGALKDKTDGGGELQIALLAKSLALSGHEVVIVDPYSKDSFTTREGIKLINIPGWNKGIKGIRVFLHRIPSLRKILIEQKADYYYVRMRSYLHLVAYRASRKTKGKFIVAIAHDLDVLSFGKKFKYSYLTKFNLFKLLSLYIPNDWVFNYILKRADYVLLQHSGQKLYLKKIKGEAAIFQNIFDPANLPATLKPTGDYYIHVGALTVLKGSINLYKLICILNKNIRLMLVGNHYDKRSGSIIKKIGNFENIILKGQQNHGDAIRLIANAKALISTSNLEGFPNIFLEAWATGTPVISLNVNPGNVFDKFQLGIHCNGDLNKMKECIESGALTDMNRDVMKNYVSEFHNFDTAAERFCQIIKST